MSNARKPKFRVGQVVMARLDGKWVPFVVVGRSKYFEGEHWEVRDRAKDVYVMPPDRLRTLTRRELGKGRKQ